MRSGKNKTRMMTQRENTENRDC